ncbi:MAG: hypothetical protein LUC22_03535 [Prevotella sp.]|nr:hypothetical protein [Prevotella sp.]
MKEKNEIEGAEDIAPGLAPAEDEAKTSAKASLMQIIKEQATEEDTPASTHNFSLRKIIGGEILTAEIVRRQIWLVLIIMVFLIAYIAQGYSYKKYILEIDRLSTQLKDAKYRALSVRSDLTEHTRESRIIQLLKINNDSLLQRSAEPPYIIEVPE